MPCSSQIRSKMCWRRYFAHYLTTARACGVGFILDTATWRANADWGRKLGYGPQDLDRLNREAVALAVELRDTQGPKAPPIVINVPSGRGGTATRPTSG
jgi:homocysteine S-methyltransferase